MPTYTITQQTNGTLHYTVEADSREEAIEMVESGNVGYDVHEWEESDSPYVEYED